MSDKITQLTSTTFDKFLYDNKLVVVDFWAEWCGPCRALAPILDQVAEKLEGKAMIAKVNVDDNRGVSLAYKVQSIPNICIFKNGELVDRVVGTKPAKDLIDLISKHI